MESKSASFFENIFPYLTKKTGKKKNWEAQFLRKLVKRKFFPKGKRDQRRLDTWIFKVREQVFSKPRGEEVNNQEKLEKFKPTSYRKKAGWGTSSGEKGISIWERGH
ncbi:hypothetical protein Tco_1099191 [Tanacetum coccineum]